MGGSRLSWLASGLVFGLLSQVGLAHQLAPIEMLDSGAAHVVARDSDYSKLDLLKAETFLWGGLSGMGKYALGNFTAYTPGKHESIIAMEKFYPLLKSTECTNHSLTMNFEDERAYRYSRKTWKWVNNKEHHTFLLVAGKGHCHWNEDRLPFTIKNVEFDDKTNTIKALGKASDWIEATHSYELFVGGRPATNKRDIDEPYTFDISTPLPLNNAKFGLGDATLAYTCNGCGLQGAFEFDFHIKTELDIPTDAEILISPHGVAAVFEPDVKLSADLSGKIDESQPIGKIPIGGVSIAGGILDLGPEIAFDFVYSLGPLKGSAEVTGGGTASLQDSAQLTLDLLNPDVAASGWTPQFSSKPLTINAAISGSVQMGIDCGVVLSLSALDQGFDIGVKLSPYIGSTLTLKDSSGDACPGQSGHHGVSLANSVGINLVGEASPIVTSTLAAVSWDLGSFCSAFDSGPAVPSSSFPSSSYSYSIPHTSSPSPRYLTSAPPSSFPAPLTSIPTPSSWAWPPGSSPYSSSGSAPYSSAPYASSGSAPYSSAPYASSRSAPYSSAPYASSGSAPYSSAPYASSGPAPRSSAPYASSGSNPQQSSGSPPSQTSGSVPYSPGGSSTGGSPPPPSSSPYRPLPPPSTITPPPVVPVSTGAPVPPPPPPPPRPISSSSVVPSVYKRAPGRRVRA